VGKYNFWAAPQKTHFTKGGINPLLGKERGPKKKMSPIYWGRDPKRGGV